MLGSGVTARTSLWLMVSFMACSTAPVPEVAPASSAPVSVLSPPPGVADEAGVGSSREVAPQAGGAVLSGDAEAGARVYAKNCVACHQADGTGMGGMLGADFVNDESRKGKSDDQLLASITHGVPDTSMIGWGKILDDQARQDVVVYIRSQFMK